MCGLTCCLALASQTANLFLSHTMLRLSLLLVLVQIAVVFAIVADPVSHAWIRGLLQTHAFDVKPIPTL